MPFVLKKNFVYPKPLINLMLRAQSCHMLRLYIVKTTFCELFTRDDGNRVDDICEFIYSITKSKTVLPGNF